MDYDIEPVYMKDVDVNHIDGNVIIKTCTSIQKQFPGEIHGAQKMSNYYKLYPRSNSTRAALIVRGINIDNKLINIYDANPMQFDTTKSERVLIKDLPASIPPHKVMAFLKSFKHITVRSKVIYARERMAGDEMSPFINGDRIVYISPNVSPPLPKETVICGSPCRVWHASQKNYCKRCGQQGHRTTDTENCDSYDADSNVSAFRSDNNPLSNYYSCTIVSGDLTFKSSEHLYQYEFCMHCERSDLAQEVIKAQGPKFAKQIATELKSQIPPETLADWCSARLIVMQNVLKLKWNSCSKFRHALMATSGMVIAEATLDSFWGVGVAPNLAQETRRDKFLGQNHLGRLLMGLRDYVASREPESFNAVEFPPTSVPRTISAHCESDMTSSDATPDHRESDMTSSDATSDEPSLDRVNDSAPSSSTILENIKTTETNSSSTSDTLPNVTSPPVDDSPPLEKPALGESMSLDPPDMDCSPMESPKDVNDTLPLETLEDSTSKADTHISNVTVVTKGQPPSSPKPCRASRPPRKVVQPKSKNKPSATGTLDNYVSRTDSPGTKRKLSNDSLSPSSVQSLKSTRTDGADEVS